MQSQKVLSAYFTREEILPFGFAGQYCPLHAYKFHAKHEHNSYLLYYYKNEKYVYVMVMQITVPLTDQLHIFHKPSIGLAVLVDGPLILN